MLNKNDKDKLMTLGALLIFITLVFIFYHTTKFIPVKYIAAVCLVLSMVCFGLISSAYLRVYGCYSAIHAWVPVFNCLNTFATPVALVLLINIVFTVLCAIFANLPVDIILKFLPERTAMWYYDRATVVLLLSIISMYLIISIGYCGIYRDARRMLCEATGLTRPKSELINYPLLFVPVVSIMAYASIITSLNHLQRFNYVEGAQINSEDTKYNEVLK